MEKKIHFPKMTRNIIYVFVIFVFNYSCQGIEYSVLEGKQAGTFIGNIRTDANLRSYVDQQNFEQLRFSFLNQEGPQVKYFNISEENGDIFTASVLDREEICKFSSTCTFPFTVAAQSSIGPFFKKVSFTIKIEDVNDNTPAFSSSSMFVSLSESVVVGASITVAGAVDEDSGNFSVVRYEILPDTSPFSAEFSKNLDGSSVVRIIVLSTLDRETKDNYQLQLVAIDGGIPPKSGVLLVNVTISDVNDNRPIFSSSVYNVTVKEDIAINSTILRVTAIDLDAGENGKIVYRLSPNQAEEIKSLFALDATNGDLRILKNFVYSAAGMYKIIIEASDLGLQPLTTQTLVQVYIEDVRNHPPRISVNLLSSGPYAKTSEYANDGTVVALIAVSDDDKGRNGIVNCSIESDFFLLQRLDVNEYKVIVSRSLDRERQDNHQVVVYCQDIGTPPLNSMENFTVKVLDENDNSPVFSKYVYEAAITENNKVNAVVTQVHADDQDIGLNGQIYYVLNTNASKTFSVDSNGLITSKVSLDRETKDYYRVEVFAIDGGSPSLTSSATIIVIVNDTNDNAPEFILPYYKFEIEENQPVDTFVGEVNAFDRDSLNGVVSYNLNSDAQSDLPFVLLPDGKLKTKGRLDREVQGLYAFMVTAIDQGIPKRMYSSVNVTVKINDKNDNIPVILSPPDNTNFIFYVTLSTPVQTPVYQIQAHDEDEGENARLIYQVVGRNDSSIFDVDNSGQVFISRKMTESDAKLYYLNISVSDCGLPPQQIILQLHLDVTARNENQTSLAQVGDDLHNQNLLIVLSVVLITAVLAATILVTICVIRHMDRKKPRFMDADTSSNQSGDIAVVTGLTIDAKKILNISLSRDSNMITSSFPNNHVYPRCSSSDQDKYDAQNSRNMSSMADGDDMESLQLSLVTPEDSDSSQLHRLASLRIQQALLKSHENPWKNNNHNSPETTLEKKNGDNHSEMSADTGGTCDSGRGGSVSDLQSNMGMSQDSDDSRILQLQNNVCQSGRRGLPPHKDQSKFSNKMLLKKKPVCTSPRGKTGLGIQMGLSSISINNYRSQPHYNSSPLKDDSMDFHGQMNSVMDRSELRGQCPSPSCIKETETQSKMAPTYSVMHSNQLPQECLQNSKYFVMNTRYPSYKSDGFKNNRGDSETYNHERNCYPSNHHIDMNDTIDSMATTFDDDDNTTTSGSYTIDNSYDDFIEELNVTKFRDVLV